MKKLFIITVLMAMTMSGFAQILHYDFSAVCETGQTLYYLITSEEEHIVTLTYPYSEENEWFVGNYYELFTKPEGEIVIPSVVAHNGIDYSVTAIDRNAFTDCEGLIGVLDIPDGVISIGQWAFDECSFSSIIIPSSVSFIASSPFTYCEFIESIVVDDGNSIYYSENNSIIRREDKALIVGCKTTTIPDDVEIICSYAFFGAGDGGNLIIPNSVKTIEEYAFADCRFSGSLVLSDALETIGKYAFSVGSFSGSLTIPNSVTEMGHDAFSDCQYLTGTLTLSSSLSSIDANAFYNTRFTGTLFIPNSVKSIGGGAFCWNNFSELVLGDSLVTIVDVAFENCYNLTGTLRLPSSITEIGTRSFCHTSFNEIYSPNRIPPTLGVNVFYEYDPTIPIHIPFGCTEAYQNASGWNYFTNFIEEEPIIYTDFEPDLCVEELTPYDSHDTLKIDLDQDGTIDFKMYIKAHYSTQVRYVYVTSSWDFRYCYNSIYSYGYMDENDSIIPNHPLWAEANDTWELLWYPDQYMEFIMGFRKTVNDENYYAWARIYMYRNLNGNGYQPGPGEFDIVSAYCDDVAYCTIPDYPLRWGQTSLESFVLDNSEWYYEILNNDGSITYQHLECAGDTTINNERPKVIVRSNTQYDRDSIITTVTHEYVYDKNGKLYWWNKDLEDFTVLYDLNAEVGDEWEIKVGSESLTMHVDAVENYEYEGKIYRILSVSDEGDLFSGNIVCGIGHLTSFFPERLMNRDKGYRVEGLRCYWVEDELVFKYGDDDCDAIYAELHNGIEEDGPSTPSTGSGTAGTLMVYPNPANNILFVQTLRATSLPAETYRITNLMGQTLLQGQITAETQQINIENLPAGLYFISMGDMTQKFVKQ